MTRKLYLEDPTLHSCNAEVLAIKSHEDSIGIILDQSVFYPKGGGQPSDQGSVHWRGEAISIKSVLDDNGELLHLCDPRLHIPTIGDQVHVGIDVKIRELHSRVHSAGELLCAAIWNLGHRWSVSGALHVPGQSKIVLDVNLSPDDRAVLIQELEPELKAMIQDDLDIIIDVTRDRDKVISLCGYDPTYLPISSDVRLIRIVPGYARPCMGTHVYRAGQIGSISIRSAKMKKGQLNLGYDIV